MRFNAGGGEHPQAGFNPDPFFNDIPVEDRWRAIYSSVLFGGLGSEVGLGRSMTAWRTIDFTAVPFYLSNKMNEPAPFGHMIHAGDIVMNPIQGGPSPIPATWWTTNGQPPFQGAALNPSYLIGMGRAGQVHMLQECVTETSIRIWAAFVDEVEINLQTEFVELFPYAEFPTSECGAYTASPFTAFNKKVYAYCPPGRVEPPTASEPLTSMEPGGEQFTKLFG